MALIEKEVIRPGSYWYKDQATGQPRKLDVTPEMTKHWAESGNKMLSTGLTVPVPCEHDFNAHPMTPAEKLKNNAGWIKGYKLKGDKLYASLDIQDNSIKDKLPSTIRWTSPWINSFTDGNGNEWKNVISHLALTTRPRIVEQEPFSSIAAALSHAEETTLEQASSPPRDDGTGGFCLSRAGLLSANDKDELEPVYPLAFSMWAGVQLAAEREEEKPKPDTFDDENEDGDYDPDESQEAVDLEPSDDSTGDVTMEELLCDLLNALGVQMPDNVGEQEFKRTLYDATMTKIKELTNKAQNGDNEMYESETADLNKEANKMNENNNNSQTNPLIKQEQQPMYMSLEEIQKLDEPLKTVALSMYNQTMRAEQKAQEAEKILNSLRDAKLKEASNARRKRVNLLGQIAPNSKADLEAMLESPAMALSLGEGGQVIDPMASTLAVLEKGLSDVPKLLTTDQTAWSTQPQPTDHELTDEQADRLADNMARQMGCPPEKKVG